MQHIIKKQCIELNVKAGTNDVFQLQQRFSDTYWKKIMPAIAIVFDSISAEDEVIVIEKIEIDLGAIAYKEIEEWGIEKLVADELLTLLQKRRSSGSNLPVGMKINSRVWSVCEKWMFYMDNGYLPWNSLTGYAAWNLEVLEGFASDAKLIGKLSALILKSKNALTRIVNQHQDAFLVALLESLTSSPQKHVPYFVSILLKPYKSPDRIKIFEDRVNKNTDRMLWIRFLKVAAGVNNERRNAIIKEILDLRISPSQLKQLTPKLAYKQLNQASLNALMKNINKTQNQSDSPFESDTPIPNAEDIFVQNAGLVLVHPFLNSMFQKLNLVKAGKFRSLKMQQRAIFILQYLATGNLNPQEYALVIPKLLCGYPINKPVPPAVSLKAEELEECLEVLQVLIAQWDVLKNTSVLGLMESFLQRAGKVIVETDRLWLAIESNSIDVLLDFLPWNLSIIQLPWMKQYLEVHWG